MSIICCPLFVDGVGLVDDALERARAAVAAGARLIEWRVDLLAEEDRTLAIAAVRALVRSSPAACIVTVRPSWEGGLFGGSESDRVSFIEMIGMPVEGEQPPKYLDVELDAYRTSRNRRQKFNLAVEHESQLRDGLPRLILSTHDFRERPADLMQRVAAMSEEPACAVMKIAWAARSVRDNLEAFDLLSERAKPAVVLCMGEFGLLSRVLAPKFGGLFTFAAGATGQESAPGQPTIATLRSRYRFDSIRPSTRVYGVVGWPVAHSRGPDLHNAGFTATGFDGVYLPLPIPAEWEHFKATLGALIDHPRLDFRGASVTLPHKEHLVRLVRERGGTVGALAGAIGAANTLIVEREGRLVAANTDAAAAVSSLAHALHPDAAARLDGRRIAVLGAGGVARAVAGGIALAGGTAVLIARRPDAAGSVASALMRGLEEVDPTALDACEGGAASGPLGRVLAGRGDSLGCGCYHAFVNCTPLGMRGGANEDGQPMEALADLSGAVVPPEATDDAVIMDTVYVPEWTPLLREARDRGARVVTGRAMFIAQAERQFARWTGTAPPKGLFLQALNAAEEADSA